MLRELQNACLISRFNVLRGSLYVKSALLSSARKDHMHDRVQDKYSRIPVTNEILPEL